MQTAEPNARSDRPALAGPKDEVLDAIRTLYSALSSDHGEQFLRQFRGTGHTPKAWADRLKSRIGGCDPGAVIDGYERLVIQLNGARMPTTDEIVKSIRDEQRNRTGLAKSSTHSAESETDLAFDGGIPGYVEAIENANRGNPVAEAAIAEIRGILKRPAPRDESERRERLKSAMADQAELVEDAQRKGRIRQVLLHENPNCAYGGCPKPGTMSRSTTGTNAWFCGEHFRMMGS